MPQIVIHAFELAPGMHIGGLGTVTAVLDPDDGLAEAEGCTEDEVCIIFLHKRSLSVRCVSRDMPCWVDETPDAGGL